MRGMSSLRKYVREAWLSKKAIATEKVEFFDGQTSKMERSKLVFFDRKGRYVQRVGSGAPIYLAAMPKYLPAEALELVGNVARDNKKNRIIPWHLLLDMRNDEELGKFMAGVTIAHGGVLPNIHQILLTSRSRSPN